MPILVTLVWLATSQGWERFNPSIFLPPVVIFPLAIAYTIIRFRLLDKVEARLPDAALSDQSKMFNTARLEALELENLMGIARATLVSALARTESRGAHTREDHPKRDDDQWLRHTLYFRENDTLDYKPVRLKPLTVETFQPKERTY